MKSYIYILISFIFFASSSAWATTPELDVEEDHDDVLEAVEQGLIQPYSSLLILVGDQLDGRVIRVELEEDDDEWIYELKLLDTANNIVKVEYDAKTLRIIQIKGRNLENVIKK